MPGIRQYPEATTTESTDAFVFDREGVGTMFIEAQNLGTGGGSSDPYIHTYTPYDIIQYQPAVDYIVTSPFTIDLTCNAVSSFRLLDDERTGDLTFTMYCYRQLDVGHLEQPIGTIYWNDTGSRYGSFDLSVESWDFLAGDELIIMPPSDVGSLGGAACLACAIKTVPTTDSGGGLI